MTSIALTGHRPSKLDGYDLTTPFYQLLRERLLRVAVGAVLDARELGQPFATLHSGMALGADTLWAQVICDLKEHYPGEVRFVAHVPFSGQCARWPAQAQQVYRDLLARADQVRTYGTEYTPAVMQARNVGMIDVAERLVAIFNGHPQGGTANALRYARSTGTPVLLIDPASLRAS